MLVCAICLSFALKLLHIVLELAYQFRGECPYL